MAKADRNLIISGAKRAIEILSTLDDPYKIFMIQPNFSIHELDSAFYRFALVLDPEQFERYKITTKDIDKAMAEKAYKKARSMYQELKKIAEERPKSFPDSTVDA